ncbi:MAG: ATP-binding protein [Candidatus Nitrosopolaris sp.]
MTKLLVTIPDNILDIARIESQSINLNKQVVNIDTIILDAIQDVTKDQSHNTHDVKLLYHNINRKQDLADHEAIEVYVDRGRIIQVISNLISNAFNFTKKGVVTITKGKSVEDGSFIVSVKDTGSGIEVLLFMKAFIRQGGTGYKLNGCRVSKKMDSQH